VSIQQSSDDTWKGDTDVSEISLYEAKSGKEGVPLSKTVYEAYIESPYCAGEAKLIIEEDGLWVDTLFNQTAISYAEITSIALLDYSVHIRMGNSSMIVSRIGNACEWFYRELYDAYNRKVLSALLVEGTPDFETEGGYLFHENGNKVQGSAKIKIFEDCICVLPPDCNARRIPFVFVNGMKQEDYTITLTLNTGEIFSFSKLGYDTEPFRKQIADHIRGAREKAVASARELDGTLSMAQTALVAKLMPDGLAAGIDKLYASVPSFAAVVEQKIGNSQMAETYPLLKKLGDDTRLCVGIKHIPHEGDKEQQLPEAENEYEAEVYTNVDADVGIDIDTDADMDVDVDTGVRSEKQQLSEKMEQQPILWVVVPGKNNHVAAVELALPREEAAATYIYSIDSDWESFLLNLSRVLDAVKFQREIISLSDEELQKEQYAKYRMVLTRTPSLRILRSQFVGRVIHTSIESWEKGLLKYLEPKAPDKLISNYEFQSSCASTDDRG
jgi:hypothetical protein